jgi:hypothetical protein
MREKVRDAVVWESHGVHKSWNRNGRGDDGCRLIQVAVYVYKGFCMIVATEFAAAMLSNLNTVTGTGEF